MTPEEERLTKLLINLKIWNPTTLTADLTIAAKLIDELQKEIVQLKKESNWLACR